MRTAVVLLIYAGLRVQEACDVQLRDVDLAGGTVTVRSGKGGKARRLPLHPDAQRLLLSYLNEVRCPAGIPPSEAIRGVNRSSLACRSQLRSILLSQASKRVIRKRIA